MPSEVSHQLTDTEKLVVDAAVAIAKHLDRCNEYSIAYDDKTQSLAIWRRCTKNLKIIDTEEFVKNKSWFDELYKDLEEM